MPIHLVLVRKWAWSWAVGFLYSFDFDCTSGLSNWKPYRISEEFGFEEFRPGNMVCLLLLTFLKHNSFTVHTPFVYHWIYSTWGRRAGVSSKSLALRRHHSFFLSPCAYRSPPFGCHQNILEGLGSRHCCVGLGNGTAIRRCLKPHLSSL